MNFSDHLSNLEMSRKVVLHNLEHTSFDSAPHRKVYYEGILRGLDIAIRSLTMDEIERRQVKEHPVTGKYNPKNTKLFEVLENGERHR